MSTFIPVPGQDSQLPPRTDEQQLTMAPIVVRFGTVDYDIKPLPMKKAQQWRAQLIETAKEIASTMKQDATISPAFLNGLAFILLQFPEKLVDLVCAYSPELPRETIENEGTEEQLSRAFGQVVQVAFPFVGELRAISQTLSLAATFPRSESSSKSH